MEQPIFSAEPERRLTSENLACHILYRDYDLIVLNKPNRLPLYKGPGGGEVLADILPLLRFDANRDPAPAHRLDSATSGCLVLGRSKRARRQISELFVAGGAEKLYWAIVSPVPQMTEGVITLPLLDVGWPGRPRVRVRPQGKRSQTLFHLLGHDESHAWLALMPLTGRTHQLRVHCAAMGSPIVGDPLYGGVGGEHLTLHLHARRLSLGAPFARSFCAPAPEHMQHWISRFDKQP
uniref:Putative Pseudouridine synthase n=1 Tax=Magnetococcus massalia (strain MO-1) TaxID=451514 RepID=A0A1S7LJ10_MAGMO|nr:putative Pseudouridine synthase [Candidatus Magnetococcus massalia]